MYIILYISNYYILTLSLPSQIHDVTPMTPCQMGCKCYIYIYIYYIYTYPIGKHVLEFHCTNMFQLWCCTIWLHLVATICDEAQRSGGHVVGSNVFVMAIVSHHGSPY